MALTKIKADGLTADLIDETKLADNSIDSEHYNDGSIDNAHLADNAVGTAEIADNAVDMNKLSDLDNGRIIARVSSGSGNPEAATAAQVRTLLNVADGATYSNISGNVDHRVLTATGTTGISQGEEKLTWNGNNLHIERTVNAYEQPLVNIYNSGAYGWGGAIRFSANWANTEEHQATIRTYGGSSATGATLAFNVGAANSEKLRIQNGGGISFNGDTAAANALDDYEEGTFTPELGGDGNIGVYNVDGSGQYTKIGRQVDVHMVWEDVDLHGASTGSVQIKGLPFTCNGWQYSTSTDHYLYNVGFSNTKIQSWYVNNNDTTIGGIQSDNDSAWGGWPVGNFQAGGMRIRLHMVYYTS